MLLIMGYRQVSDRADIVMEMEKASAKATSFLKSKQDQDGKWVDFKLEAGISTAWTTAFVATALSRRGEARDSSQKACLWLFENFRQGWGFNETVPTDCDSTAWGIMAFISNGVDLPAGGVDALSPYRDSSGLYKTFVGRAPNDYWGHSHIDVTAVALRALLQSGSSSPDLIIQTVDRLVKSGEGKDLHAYWWDDDIYAIAHTLETLSDFILWGMRTDFKSSLGLVFPKLVGRIDSICSLYRNEIQNALLSVDPFKIALGTRAWVCAGGEIDCINKAIDSLLNMQLPDGRWEGRAKLRVTNPNVSNPWEHDNPGPVYSDIRDVFTTATVVDTLDLAKSHLK